MGRNPEGNTRKMDWLKDHEFLAGWIGALVGVIAVIPIVVGWYKAFPIFSRFPLLKVFYAFLLLLEGFLLFGTPFSFAVRACGALSFTVILGVFMFEVGRAEKRSREEYEEKEKERRQMWKKWK